METARGRGAGLAAPPDPCVFNRSAESAGLCEAAPLNHLKCARSRAKVTQWGGLQPATLGEKKVTMYNGGFTRSLICLTGRSDTCICEH